MKVKNFFNFASLFGRRLKVFSGGDFVGVVGTFPEFSEIIKKQFTTDLHGGFFNGLIIEAVNGLKLITQSGRELDIFIIL